MKNKAVNNSHSSSDGNGNFLTRIFWDTRLPTERFNYLSHLFGFVLWIPLSAILIAMSARRSDLLIVSVVYGLCTAFMFFASANYHYFKREENEQSLRRRMDHMAIFVMIAGSYTPLVYVWYQDPWRLVVLILQWSLTALGIVFKLTIRRPPRWLSPLLYLAMGWVAIGAIVPLWTIMPHIVFYAMFGGGLLYTIGAVIYATKRPVGLSGILGFHEIFHVFILAGALTHYVMQYLTISAALSMPGL